MTNHANQVKQENGAYRQTAPTAPFHTETELQTTSEHRLATAGVGGNALEIVLISWPAQYPAHTLVQCPGMHLRMKFSSSFLSRLALEAMARDLYPTRSADASKVCPLLFSFSPGAFSAELFWVASRVACNRRVPAAISISMPGLSPAWLLFPSCSGDLHLRWCFVRRSWGCSADILVWNTSNFLLIAMLFFQHSEPYRRTLRTFCSWRSWSWCGCWDKWISKWLCWSLCRSLGCSRLWPRRTALMMRYIPA